MFKKSRRRIVAAIMSILILLFAGTLGVIYGSSYLEVSNRNRQMLERYAGLFSLDRQPGEDNLLDHKQGRLSDEITTDEIDGDIIGGRDAATFELNTFYAVALDDNGEVLATDNDGITVYTDEQLAQIAREVIAGGKESGTRGQLIYLVTPKDDYTLVSLMDNTIMQESTTTLFRYTLLYGGIAIVAFFFLAMYLARRIVKPLEESHEKQTQFISDAGHELKTPISVVSANAEMLTREIGDNQWLNNIQYENERMGTLVKQLLELSRMDHDSIQLEELDFSRLVSGEALPFESVAFEKGLQLTCDIAEGIRICGDSGKLKQLTAILLDNAVDHSAGGEQISLTLHREGNQGVLQVTNPGEAIPEESRERIFERFYRIDSVRNSEDNHYGIGLAIAKAIVIAHKGNIHVECHHGKVEFTVKIPLK